MGRGLARIRYGQRHRSRRDLDVISIGWDHNRVLLYANKTVVFD